MWVDPWVIFVIILYGEFNPFIVCAVVINELFVSSVAVDFLIEYNRVIHVE